MALRLTRWCARGRGRWPAGRGHHCPQTSAAGTPQSRAWLAALQRLSGPGAHLLKDIGGPCGCHWGTWGHCTPGQVCPAQKHLSQAPQPSCFQIIASAEPSLFAAQSHCKCKGPQQPETGCSLTRGLSCPQAWCRPFGISSPGGYYNSNYSVPLKTWAYPPASPSMASGDPPAPLLPLLQETQPSVWSLGGGGGGVRGAFQTKHQPVPQHKLNKTG